MCGEVGHNLVYDVIKGRYINIVYFNTGINIVYSNTGINVVYSNT